MKEKIKQGLIMVTTFWILWNLFDKGDDDGIGFLCVLIFTMLIDIIALAVYSNYIK